MSAHDFDLNTVTGLSESEAAERLRSDGPNELPTTRERSLFAIAAGVAREPMFLLLLVCGAIYFSWGSAGSVHALSALLCSSPPITLYQERKTERTLEALRDPSSPGLW